MMGCGFIRHNHNPFLFNSFANEKKKDDMWRFCINYQDLNALSIKDKFSIPTIDELLDELGGMTIFFQALS